MSVPDDHAERYLRALDRFLTASGEDALSDAYELGREALAAGLGVLYMAAVHHDALRQWRGRHDPADPGAVLAAAGAFFGESLSAFEMHSRRIDESNAAWRRLNELLEEEVKRIARALHDEAGNIIAHAGLEMDLATNDLAPEIRARLALARQLLDDTGEQLRHLSHELRPAVLDDLGLMPALEFLAEGVERRTGMRVEVNGALRGRIAAAVEFATYRIAQEALNNVLRHGGGSTAVTVRVEQRESCLECVIADDGVGFDVEGILADVRKRGLGLLGMRERAAAVGGECVVKSAPGRGTSIELRMPV